jgi:hypothetical protein
MPNPSDRAIAQYPHCDQRVLHAPGECRYCDEHPDWQELRRTWNINFTGKKEPGKSPCPAEASRTARTIHEWHGNRPTEVEVDLTEPDRYVRILDAETEGTENGGR